MPFEPVRAWCRVFIVLERKGKEWKVADGGVWPIWRICYISPPGVVWRRKIGGVWWDDSDRRITGGCYDISPKKCRGGDLDWNARSSQRVILLCFVQWMTMDHCSARKTHQGCCAHKVDGRRGDRAAEKV